MHDPALKKRAQELRKQGLLIKVIAVDLGVPKATATRWLNPELEKRERARARKLKYGKGKTPRCPHCKKKKTEAASLCRSCHLELVSRDRYWNRERVIEAIQTWAAEKGHAPVYEEWQKSGKGHPAISTIRDGAHPVFGSLE